MVVLLFLRIVSGNSQCAALFTKIFTLPNSASAKSNICAITFSIDKSASKILAQPPFLIIWFLKSIGYFGQTMPGISVK